MFYRNEKGMYVESFIILLYLNKYIEMHYENESKGLYIDEYFSNLFMLLYADDIAQFSEQSMDSASPDKPIAGVL